MKFKFKTININWSSTSITKKSTLSLSKFILSSLFSTLTLTFNVSKFDIFFAIIDIKTILSIVIIRVSNFEMLSISIEFVFIFNLSNSNLITISHDFEINMIIWSIWNDATWTFFFNDNEIYKWDESIAILFNIFCQINISTNHEKKFKIIDIYNFQNFILQICIDNYASYNVAHDQFLSMYNMCFDVIWNVDNKCWIKKKFYFEHNWLFIHFWIFRLRFDYFCSIIISLKLQKRFNNQ